MGALPAASAPDGAARIVWTHLPGVAALRTERLVHRFFFDHAMQVASSAVGFVNPEFSTAPPEVRPDSAPATPPAPAAPTAQAPGAPANSFANLPAPQFRELPAQLPVHGEAVTEEFPALAVLEATRRDLHGDWLVQHGTGGRCTEPALGITTWEKSGFSPGRLAGTGTWNRSGEGSVMSTLPRLCPTQHSAPRPLPQDASAGAPDGALSLCGHVRAVKCLFLAEMALCLARPRMMLLQF